MKKSLGQNFLRDHSIIRSMVGHAHLHENEYVLEIGCGDGAVTEELLATPIALLTVVELDPHWAQLVQNKFQTKRLQLFNENILDFDSTKLTQQSPVWSIVASIPYCITSPILQRVIRWKSFLKQAVLMIQEDVAQKLVKTRGKDYGYLSILIQYHFVCTLHEKVPPDAFYPAPKVFSRLIRLVPRIDAPNIQNKDEFWKFIACIFAQPRRTIANNIKTSIYLDKVPNEYLQKRAQELSVDALVQLWNSMQTQGENS